MTSIGAAIDYLVGIFTTGFVGKDIYGNPLTVPALSTINPLVEVADNIPQTDSGAWVVVGRSDPGTESQVSATAQYQVLGRQRITESYQLPGMILVYGSGPDQKTTRDAALALFAGVNKLVWADPTLGGVLQDGRIGMVAGFTFSQPDDPTDSSTSSGGGVAASVAFDLQVENSYIP